MVSPQPTTDGVIFAPGSVSRHLGVPPIVTFNVGYLFEASQMRTATPSVSGPGRTDISFRRHLNSKRTDPSHCPPPQPQATSAAAAEGSHEDVTPLPRELMS